MTLVISETLIVHVTFSLTHLLTYLLTYLHDEGYGTNASCGVPVYFVRSLVLKKLILPNPT